MDADDFRRGVAANSAGAKAARVARSILATVMRLAANDWRAVVDYSMAYGDKVNKFRFVRIYFRSSYYEGASYRWTTVRPIRWSSTKSGAPCLLAYDMDDKRKMKQFKTDGVADAIFLKGVKLPAPGKEPGGAGAGTGQAEPGTGGPA